MERTGLAAALAFSVLYLLSGVVVAAPPAPDAPAAEMQRWLVNHEDGIRASAWLAGASVVPFLVFLALLRGRLGLASGWPADTAFAAGLLLVAVGSAAALLPLGLTLQAQFTEPETVRALLDVQRFFAPVATAAVFSLAAATALATLRAGVLPRWVGVASLLYAAYQLFESVTLFGGESGGFAPGGSVNLAGTLLFLPWALAVGIGLTRPYPRTGADEGD